MHESEKGKWSCSVVSDSSRPHGLQPTRLLRPWDFPGKSTGVGCHCLLRNTHAIYTNFFIVLALLKLPHSYFFYGRITKSNSLADDIPGLLFSRGVLGLSSLYSEIIWRMLSIKNVINNILTLIWKTTTKYVKFLDYFRQTMSAIISKLQLSHTLQVSKFYKVLLSMYLKEKEKKDEVVMNWGQYSSVD